MKNLITVLLTLLLYSFVSAQSYHTISIDGNNDFNVTSEQLTTTSGTSLYGYVTWDQNYLYVGYSGNSPAGNFTDDNRVVHIYLDTDPQQVPKSGNGTSDGEAWRWDPNLPINADYHYAFKTVSNEEVKREYNGSWADAFFSVDNFKGNSYWEARFLLSDLGDPEQINLVSYVEEDWDGSGQISGGLPSNLFTNTSTQGAITFNDHYLNFYLIEQVTPNLNLNVDNYQWLIRLKASTTSLSDTNIYAGMALNATDNFDTGFDIAQPPSPPSDFVDVYFNLPDWTSSMGPNYTRNIRKLISLDSTTSTWDFKVNTDQNNEIITLSISDFNFVPNNYDLKLLDIDADVTHNFITGGVYQYNSGSSPGEKSFRLIVGVALTSPTISSDVDSLAFGSVKINANKTLNVTVQNSGDSTLTVSGLTFSNSVFSTTLGTPFSITTGNTQVIPVKFAPTSAIAYLDSLTISSNDPNTPSYQVMLTGTGLELVPVVSTDVTSLDFGSIKVDYDTTLSFKVYNTGDITLNVSGITFTHSDFMLNESASFSVAVGNSVERTVTFSPNTVMNYTDSLTIASDDPVNSEIVIELLADGLAAEESYDFTAGWNLMALPLVPDNFAASEIIGDDAASYFLYSYSSSGGYQNVNTFEMGKGYWLGLESDAAIDMIGTPKIDSTIVPLNNGWNIVGDPYVRDYPTSALQIVKNNVAYNITTAVDSGWVQNAFYSYNAAGGTYESATLFDQWKGYWFAALSADLSLLFHHDSTTGTPLKIAPGMIEADLQNWAVNIKASRDGFTDELLAFGVKSDASDGFDSGYDMAKPPISPSANAIETYFPHNDWTNIISKFAADIKEPFQSPEIKSWTFNLYSKQDGEITLSWENILEQLPAEIDDVILQGEVVTNGEISMTEKLNLTFNASAGTTYEFLISSIAVGIQDKESIPLEFKLEQNYPNPFNPATTINYQIPEDGFVSLKLYNILGAEIATLINEFQTAGYYQHTFNSASLDAGLSSGVYLYEIKVGQHSSIKKMVLLR